MVVVIKTSAKKVCFPLILSTTFPFLEYCSGDDGSGYLVMQSEKATHAKLMLEHCFPVASLGNGSFYMRMCA